MLTLPNNTVVHLRDAIVLREETTVASRKSAPAGRPLIGRLILTRQCNEAILLGDQIVVQVIALRRTTVTLRIIAPQQLLVLRAELSGESPQRSRRRGPGQR
jgi:carbon storage regulator CsrA